MNDNQSQERKRIKHPAKALILSVSLLLILGVSAGATMAYLTKETETTNTFEPVNAVGPAVIMSAGDGGTDITIQVSNTDYAVYLRARVAGSWKDAAGNVLAAPAEDAWEFTPGAGWQEGADGFWYYQYPAGAAAPAEGSEAVPVTVPFGSYTVTPGAAPESGETDCSLCVDVLAQAVQITPEAAVKEAWGMRYDTDKKGWSVALPAAGEEVQP